MCNYVCVCRCVYRYLPLHRVESAVYLSSQRIQPRTCHMIQQTTSTVHGNYLNTNIVWACSGGTQSHTIVSGHQRFNVIHYSGALPAGIRQGQSCKVNHVVAS